MIASAYVNAASKKGEGHRRSGVAAGDLDSDREDSGTDRNAHDHEIPGAEGAFEAVALFE
jgi:hypothetical protein